MGLFSGKELYGLWRQGMENQNIEVQETWDDLNERDQAAWEYLADAVNG